MRQVMEDFRRRQLSIHQTIARDAAPAEIIRTARALDCAHVCWFTQAPMAASPFPVVTDDEIAELRKLMDGLGVGVLGTTSFALHPDTQVSDYDAGLAHAAALGAWSTNVRILDTDHSRNADNFGALGALARGEEGRRYLRSCLVEQADGGTC